MLNTELMFATGEDARATPQAFFDRIHRDFAFTLDAAATKGNRKVERYLGPDHANPAWRDALQVEWAEVTTGPVWLNPPYSRCREFIAKAAEEARKGLTVVSLVPSRTDTRWWHEHVWDASTNRPRAGVEVRFIKGRLRFGTAKASAPFPSAVVVFRPLEIANGFQKNGVCR